MVSGYSISSNPKEMDLSVIHGYLSNSYWAKGIPWDVMEKAVKNSLCFGVFTSTGDQVAFARIITDYATFAYLADVFVLQEHRGKGLSKRLLKTIIEYPDLQGLRRMLLATRDAHGLYQQFGFTPLNSPDLFMELHQPDVYLKIK
jgi:GNAT superfamily N-acetyltransferase